MKIRNLGCLLLGAVAAFALPAQQAHALLAGVKTTGMAATSVSYPVDAFAGAYNPAAINLLDDRMDLGVSWVQFYQRSSVHDNQSVLNILHPDNPLNGSRNAAKTPNVYVPEFGINKHFCFDWCGKPFHLTTGLVVYNRNYLKTTYGKPITLLGNTKPGLEYIHETIAPMLAINFCEQHNFGVSLNVNVQRVKINGLQNFDNPRQSDSPGNVTNKGYNWSTGVGVTLGYLWQPTECFRLGASWTPKTSAGHFKKYKGFLADHGNFPTPMRFQAGLSYNIWSCLAVAFDYEYVKWQDVPHLKNHFLPNLFEEHLGDKKGAGLGFKNQHYYRFGLDYTLNECWDFRAGFRHANCIVPRSETAPNLLADDLVQNVLTLGTTYHINACNEISLLYAHGFEKKVKGKDSIPAQQPFGGGEVDLKQSLNVWGVSWGMKF